ncbi:BrnT family toxin [Dickeya dianthicola]|uniref:BrnT family toxin n=1 Tax=Dickeya dianthicola TaxID=204039 RepID=UPI001F624416|nr:BrnT family toxin [Dickeya dianthicola]MCI4031480.1 BrnT family toxin [Dickeya dianthicola]MCI4174594.1 BrnT family toxin [Dickeya dianthicola]MCI4179546.1 BrnT family toxin [Dickeya dianthicola]MCI4180347.1 BrnT family toxin [Dickeya dianthicola]MCI4194054.1 BrnT family toxin [Dickeya dianthicola]
MNRDEALKLIVSRGFDEFFEKTKKLDCNEERIRKFFDVINGSIIIDTYSRIDIEECALKEIFPECYEMICICKHLYSSSDIYEYDPAKNGRNIIKHGLDFREVVSFSKRFGSLIIECPNTKGEDREVIFSDLNLEGKYKLVLPRVEGNEMMYVISVVKNIGGKIRFISSRELSSKRGRYISSVRQSIRDVSFPDLGSKKEFVERCIEIIEKNLIS